MDPRLSNLEWCDRRYNMTYGDVVDRIIAGQMDQSPEFMCLENGMIYRNQTQAARELGISRSNLNEVLAGVRKAAKGLTFRWLYQMAAWKEFWLRKETTAYPLQHGRYEISKHYQIAEKPERSASAIIFSDNIVLGISLEHLAKLIDMDILIATMLKYI